MDKNVLIFFPHRLKQRHGGPYSMLYHLKQGLQSLSHNVTFLSALANFPEDRAFRPLASSTSLFKKLIKSFVPKKTLNNYKIRKWVGEVGVPDENTLRHVAFSQYQILHFHETIDVWRYRNLLENYTGIIILTSHTPKPYHLELLEDVMKLDKTMISDRSYDLIKNIDVYAYQKAQHLIFPCQEATEAYLERWQVFNKIVEEKHVDYVTTGVVSSPLLQTRKTTRLSLQIPEDAFVVSYVGRKIPVKGYDLLVEAANSLLPLYPDLYFIIVGNKDSDSSISHTRWIETGWSEDPFAYVEAGNLHVVPNRFTNFDLNVLEVLSLGKPMLLSDTGGNKYFKQFNPPGIFYHKPTVADLLHKLKACYEKKEQLDEIGKDNKEIYTSYFTAERFAQDQVRFYKSL